MKCRSFYTTWYGNSGIPAYIQGVRGGTESGSEELGAAAVDLVVDDRINALVPSAGAAVGDGGNEETLGGVFLANAAYICADLLLGGLRTVEDAGIQTALECDLARTVLQTC